MTEDTKYSRNKMLLEEKRIALEEELDSLTNMLDDTLEDSEVPELPKIWRKMKDVIAKLDEYARAGITAKEQLIYGITEQTHTIRTKRKVKIEVAEDCIREVWEEVERYEGNAKL